MLIAKIVDGKVTCVDDYRKMFPNTSFPDKGPNNEFLAEHGAKQVNLFLDHDPETQHLVMCEPYEQGDWVYMVKVEDKNV